MDYFTKELVDALKIIHTDLKNLLEAIQDHKEAIREHGNANKNATNEPLPVIATLGAPIAISKEGSPSKAKKVWKKIKTPLEVAGILAVVAYAILTYFMWREMKDTTKAAQQSADSAQSQLEITDRPWLTVSLTVEQHGFVFGKDGGAQVAFQAHIKNIGRSTANDVVVPLKVFLASDADGIFKEPEKRQRELCEKTAKRPRSDSTLPIVLFPGESDDNQTLGLGISKSEVQTQYLKATVPSAPKDMLVPIVYGCVDYRYGSSGKTHQTGFIYELQWLDKTVPQGIYPIKAIRANKSVAASDVVLQKYAFGGFYAN